MACAYGSGLLLTDEGAAMMDCPNLLPYAQALATERAGYLIRQWVASSLYDRIRCGDSPSLSARQTRHAARIGAD